MAETTGTTGQAAVADSAGATAAAPQRTEGQSATPSQTTVAGTDSGQESFFDPKSIEHSPELKAAYKQMQSKWTKELQKFKEGSKKAQAYDQFASNPVESMQKLAQQLGYNLVQRDPNAKGEPDAEPPKTWQDVYSRAKQEVLKELQPVLGEVKQLKQQNVEQYLDNNYGDWRTYETEMMQTLQSHPTLAHDPDKLYRLSVPEEVWEARATKAAMAKLKGSSENGQISGPSAATKQTTNQAPPKGGTFNDYVAYAKAQLAREGIRPLGG